MSFKCNGLCQKVETTNTGKERYAKGEKYCTVCEKFIFVFTSRCACCNSPLRVTQLHKKRVNDRGLLD